jgi:hypothetical protein
MPVEFVDLTWLTTLGFLLTALTSLCGASPDTKLGVFQIKIAPSAPTDTIVR